MATIELLEKNLWKVEFPLWRKRWYSKKMTITTIFVVILEFVLIIYWLCFFPLWRQPIQIDTYEHCVGMMYWWLWTHSLDSIWSFWKRKFEKLRRLRTCRCDSKIHRYPPVSWLILQTEILPVRQKLFFRSLGHLTRPGKRLQKTMERSTHF